jgi:hypothetical protein
VPLAQGQLGADESGRVLEHVERCPACSAELDFLSDVVQAAAEPGVQDEATARPADRRRLPFWAAGLAAAALLLLFLGPRLFAPDGPGVVELAQWTPPPYIEPPIPRGEDDDFGTAMRAYSRGDYAATEQFLSRLLGEGEPAPADAPALLYRGASRVELGRLADAERDLGLAAELAQPAPLREHALWCLANVRLLRGDAPGARAALERLVAEHGTFEQHARSLLAQLDARR